MVHFRRIKKKNNYYMYAYQGNKCLQYLGREEKLTPERLNYIKRKLEGRL